ncbi:unnamed protein product [Cyprideis torosa]|uniref:Uncharacterized protein n=1 Tax=Cyprideis torosa TaxID=163714 RepID=A0A7R8ZLQ6_9CRUS|nr:unnamed protein product [Cyprideis torosa]CAG0893802.1 unnamed protein product [Cyprideis torosa]
MLTATVSATSGGVRSVTVEVKVTRTASTHLEAILEAKVGSMDLGSQKENMEKTMDSDMVIMKKGDQMTVDRPSELFFIPDAETPTENRPGFEPDIGIPPVDIPQRPSTGIPPVDIPQRPSIGIPPVDTPQRPSIGIPPVDIPQRPSIGIPPVDIPQTPNIGIPPVDIPQRPIQWGKPGKPHVKEKFFALGHGFKCFLHNERTKAGEVRFPHHDGEQHLHDTHVQSDAQVERTVQIPTEHVERFLDALHSEFVQFLSVLEQMLAEETNSKLTIFKPPFSMPMDMASTATEDSVVRPQK